MGRDIKLDNRYFNSDIILLGDSTHGTADFYHLKTEIIFNIISKQERIILIEWSFSDIYIINEYINGRIDNYIINKEPKFVISNASFRKFVEKLRELNKDLTNKIQMIGIDIDFDIKADFIGLYTGIGKILKYMILNYQVLDNEIDNWNKREQYMYEFIKCILEIYGMKVIVWIHSSHSCDYRYNYTFANEGRKSLGGILRDYGYSVFLINMIFYSGTVIALDKNNKVTSFRIDKSYKGSLESMLHFNKVEEIGLLRYIGNHYYPETELTSHYIKADLINSYDLIYFMDSVSAVNPR
jgi:erythromycin esterase-like protein